MGCVTCGRRVIYKEEDITKNIWQALVEKSPHKLVLAPGHVLCSGELYIPLTKQLFLSQKALVVLEHLRALWCELDFVRTKSWDQASLVLYCKLEAVLLGLAMNGEWAQVSGMRRWLGYTPPCCVKATQRCGLLALCTLSLKGWHSLRVWAGSLYLLQGTG